MKKLLFTLAITALSVTVSPLPSWADAPHDNEASLTEVSESKSSAPDVDPELDRLCQAGRAARERKDYAEAFEYFRESAEKGYAKSQFYLGRCYYLGEGVAKDLNKAFSWWSKAAEQGNADAQCFLGYCYRDGEGVAKDPTKAFSWFRKAAEQGDAEAQCNLGYCYRDGEGVAKDPITAFNWFSKAAEQGDADAQCALGYCYRDGEAVTKDPTKAFSWFSKAAEQGNAYAQCALGLCYIKGEGVAKDSTKAFSWFSKVAEQGDADAQLFLGILYCQGEGIDTDLAEGKKWFRRAATHDEEIYKKSTAIAKQILSEFNDIEATIAEFQEFIRFFNASLESESITDQETIDLHHENINICNEYIDLLINNLKDTPILVMAAHNGDREAADYLRKRKTQRNECLKKLKELLSPISNYLQRYTDYIPSDIHNKKIYGSSQSAVIRVPTEIYTNTKKYDNLKPYDAFTRGKQACGDGDPKGYALWESSARRGCNQAKMCLAFALLPPGHKLNKGNWDSFEFEGKTLSDAERMQRYLKWMGSAADNGSLAACQELRQVYKEGTYVPKDSAKVFHYTKVAAQLKDPDAMFDLGTRYAQGIGCQKDRAAAVKWMKQSAHAGNEDAQQWLEDRRGHYVESTETYKISSDQALQEAKRKYPNANTVSSCRYDPSQGIYRDDRLFIGILSDAHSRGPGRAPIYIVSDGYGSSAFPYATTAKFGDIVLAGHRHGVELIDDRTRTRTVRKWQGPKIGGWEDLLK